VLEPERQISSLSDPMGFVAAKGSILSISKYCSSGTKRKMKFKCFPLTNGEKLNRSYASFGCPSNGRADLGWSNSVGLLIQCSLFLQYWIQAQKCGLSGLKKLVECLIFWLQNSHECLSGHKLLEAACAISAGHNCTILTPTMFHMDKWMAASQTWLKSCTIRSSCGISALECQILAIIFTSGQ